jgi:hypothetical protein
MGILERTGRGPLLVFGLIGLGLASGGLATWWHARHAPPLPAAARPIPGTQDHVVVEVLNTTSAVGLARVATRVLRDAGIDVVYFGSDTGAALDSTQVLLRSGRAQAAARVASALGLGITRSRPDPGRLVDVTVRLGRDFAGRYAARNP